MAGRQASSRRRRAIGKGRTGRDSRRADGISRSNRPLVSRDGQPAWCSGRRTRPIRRAADIQSIHSGVGEPGSVGCAPYPVRSFEFICAQRCQAGIVERPSQCVPADRCAAWFGGFLWLGTVLWTDLQSISPRVRGRDSPSVLPRAGCTVLRRVASGVGHGRKRAMRQLRARADGGACWLFARRLHAPMSRMEMDLIELVTWR